MVNERRGCSGRVREKSQKTRRAVIGDGKGKDRTRRSEQVRPIKSEIINEIVPTLLIPLG